MTEIRPRWQSLTPEQREIAADLYLHAQELMARGLSMSDAVDMAAVQTGRVPQLLIHTTEED